MSVSQSYGLKAVPFNPDPPEVLASLSALKDEAQREKALSEATSLLSDAEVLQVEGALLQPGAEAGLAAASVRSLKLGLISDLGSAATERILSKIESRPRFQAVVTRDGPYGSLSTNARLEAALRGLGTPAGDSLLFCERVEEVRQARSLGMEAVVLPSKEHDVNDLLAAGPSRMLMSLGEIEDMLAFTPA